MTRTRTDSPESAPAFDFRYPRRVQEDKNGMQLGEARALDDIARDACDLITRESDDRLFTALTALEASVGTDWSSFETSMTYKLPRDLFPDAASFRKALDERTHEARLTAFPLLAALDPERAAPLFAKSLWLKHEGAHAVSYQANLVRNLWTRWEDLIGRLPPELPGELWLAGKFRFEALTDAQVSALPADKLETARSSVDSDDWPRILELHPAFRGDDARIALYKAFLAEEERDQALAVVRALVASRHERRTELARGFLEAFGPDDWASVNLVIETDDRRSLEEIFGELEARLSKKKLDWDPHHTDPDLRPAIRAGFALGPGDASSRFARWFEDVPDDSAAKLAHDIWMLGIGTAVDHDGTRLGTGDGDMLDKDPGWMITAARFAHHPRLGKTAHALLERMERATREALVEEHARTLRPAPPKPPVAKAGVRMAVAKKGAKKVAPKKVAKKPAPKKTVVKKRVVKKPVVKKPVVKKPVARKKAMKKPATKKPALKKTAKKTAAKKSARRKRS
jgi:hypothetical protein